MPLEWSLRFRAARPVLVKSADRPGLRIILLMSARCISSAAIWSRPFLEQDAVAGGEAQQHVVPVEPSLFVRVGFLEDFVDVSRGSEQRADLQ
jgi:hypothetical protein